MNAGAIAGLITRRGNIVTWEHAIPASGGEIDPVTRQPRLPAAGRRVATGPTGETYGTPYLVRAYVSRKISAALLQNVGIQDQRDAQIDVLATFNQEPHNGIVYPDVDTLAAWNSGNFCVFPENDPEQLDLTLVARDRFTFGRIRYLVKAAAVPIQDENVTLVWRLLVGAVTF